MGRRFDVRHLNPAYASAVRLSNPIVYKDDSYDGYCVARVLRDMVDSLPNAKHEDIFWTVRQLVRIIYGMMKTKTEYRPFEKVGGKN